MGKKVALGICVFCLINAFAFMWVWALGGIPSGDVGFGVAMLSLIVAGISAMAYASP